MKETILNDMSIFETNSKEEDIPDVLPELQIHEEQVTAEIPGPIIDGALGKLEEWDKESSDKEKLPTIH